MEIRCKSTKRYLFKIEIEEYYKNLKKEKYYANLKKMGIEVETPLVIEYPCPKCKMIEVYEIYPTHYIHIRSYKRDVDNNK